MKIMEWLGHATLNQTMVYAAYRADEAEDASAIERAAARLAASENVLEFRTAS